MIEIVLLATGAYLIGSIPTGVMLARRAGIDVQHSGSGNIGATNVARTAGRRLGILTLIGDVVKGLLPVAIARLAGLSEHAIAVVAAAAVAGHVFSIFLRFQGGKGVATGLGAMLGMAPLAAPVSGLVFAGAIGMTRTVSVGSVGAALVAPPAIAAVGYPSGHTIAATAIAALILWRHRENLGRLLSGTESKLGKSK